MANIMADLILFILLVGGIFELIGG